MLIGIMGNLKLKDRMTYLQWGARNSMALGDVVTNMTWDTVIGSTAIITPIGSLETREEH